MNREKSWLWVLGGASLLLGFLAPLLKGSTGIHGGFAIGAAVAVMALVAFALARGREGLSICLTMSALGLLSGSMLGFTATFVMTHRALPGLVAAQMAVGAFFLGRTFRRELRRMEEPPVRIRDEDLLKEFEGMSPDEVRARFESDMARISYELDRISRGTNLTLGGAALGLIAGALLLFGSKAPSAGTVIPIAMILMALSLTLIVFGRRTLSHRKF